MPLYLLFKCSLRFCPCNDVDVRSFPLAKSSEVLYFRVCFQTSDAGPDVAISHETRSLKFLGLELTPHGRLPLEKERLRILAFAAEFE